VYSRVLIDLNKADLLGESLLDDVFQHALLYLRSEKNKLRRLRRDF
jgi:hypothetical protein